MEAKTAQKSQQQEYRNELVRRNIKTRYKTVP